MIQLMWNSPTCVYIGQNPCSGNHIMRGSAVCFPSSYSAKISLHLHEGALLIIIVGYSDSIVKNFGFSFQRH